MGLAGRYRRRLTLAGVLASAILVPGCTLPACEVIDDHSLDFSAATLRSGGSLSTATVNTGDPVTVAARWTYKKAFQNATTAPTGMFDLDNDGLFETTTPISGRTQRATRTYDSEQTLRVTHVLEVTGYNFFGFRDRSVRQRTLVIDDPQTADNKLPIPGFYASPNPAPAGQPGNFYSFSVDPDGYIANHEWDLDGDGTYDVSSGTSNRQSFVYDTPGEYQVGLRVTDDLGASSTASITLFVQDYHGIEVSDRLVAAAPASPTTLDLDLSGRRRSTGKLALNGKELLEVGGTARGRFAADQLPSFLQRRELKVRWASIFNISQEIDTDSVEAFGTILFDYPAGGKSCLGFELKGPPGEEPAGIFRVIGGSGKGRVIRGQGAGTGSLDDDGLVFSGVGGLRIGKPFARIGKNGCAGLRDELRRRPENSRAAG